MKQIILFFTNLKSIKGMAKAFVVFNMAISYFDSTAFFYKLYDLSLQTFGLSLFLLTYLVIIYWIKVAKIPLESSIKKYFVVLKFILFVFLATPVFLDSNCQILKFTELENVHIIRAGVEILKIFCIEFVIEILFNVIKSFKQEM